jgi:eukaryotic-like serine/threonine-protein kinase
MDPILPGQQFGRYVIRAKLGAGGMAEVYLAEDTQLGRRVALKFLSPDTQADPIAQRRLLREARAVAAFDHPHICSVYEVGEIDGRPYIAMQHIEGEPLDARLRRTPLDWHEAITLAIQIVDAVSDAHAHGILHRDLKPANVMLTARGDAKVMDFGLAKQAADDGPDHAATVSALTGRGAIVGTASYMSPEQARGEPLDSRSDLFSVGVMLYEMVTGQRAFAGASSAEVAAAILTRQPPPLARFAPSAPAEFDRIVTKLLQKRPDHRYQTAKDLLIDLRTLKGEQDFQDRLGRTPVPLGAVSEEATVRTTAPADASTSRSPIRGQRAPARVSRGVAVAVVALLLLGVGGWFAWRAAKLRGAKAQVARIVSLAEAGRNAEAYTLAADVEPYLPGDPAIAAVMPTISDTVSVSTEPSGARVYLKTFPAAGAPPPPPRLIGTSPLTNVRIPRGEHILSIEKDGYAGIQRTVSGVVMRAAALVIMPPPIRIDEQLLPAANVPPRMVFVPGGDYRLITWSRPTDQRVRLDDYFIDQYEVSNEEFKEFVNAGGYRAQDFWRHPVLQDGRVLPWEEAQRLFVDRTGLPGPRAWSNGTFPDSKGEHPVTGITWYEAEAYAAFRGKRLATIFQWEKAARNGFVPPAGLTAMPWGVFYPGGVLEGRANFGTGTLPTTSGEFGMSPFGAYNMAGNVAEWTANDSSDGYLATGGAWGDPTYTFSQFGGRPGVFSSDKLGFRCARTVNQSAGEQGGQRIELDQEVPRFVAPTPAAFAKLAATYRYDRAPLAAKIEETIQTPEWQREKITFNGAHGARAIAYLYLPKHVQRPLQVLHFLPAGDVAGGLRSLPAAMDYGMAPYVRGGRAAFGVVLEGYVERLMPAGFVRPAANSVEYTEMVVNRVTDLRHGLDYLETRGDIDMTRLGAVAPSAGSLLGVILGAIESRYRTFVFIGAGTPASYNQMSAATNPINFAAYIRAPKLVLQGRYDEDTPLRTATEPFFALLTEPKRLTVYEGGHVPSLEVAMRFFGPWFDEQLGRVVR